MDLTRRQALFTLGALAVSSAGLSACNASAQNAGEAAPAAGAGTPAADAFPVTITHKFGETVIEAAPQRIVCVGLKEQDDLLALGIVPVGASNWLDFADGSKTIGPWAQQALGSSPKPTELDTADGIGFEAIAALQPDLILALYAGPKQADYTRLSQIAKTVAAPEGLVDYGIAWDVQAEIVGRAVGRSEQMRSLIAASKKAVTDAAAANPAFAQSTAMVITPYEGLYVYGAQDPRTRILLDLGFTLPDGFDTLFSKDTSTFGGNISAEKAEILDVGALVCFADEGSQQRQIETGLFKSQNVYKQGRTVWLRNADRANPPFSFLTVLSLPYLLDALVPRLAAAVDGDPATATDQS